MLAVDDTVRLVGFGHVGKGNLHYNLQAPEVSDHKGIMNPGKVI